MLFEPNDQGLVLGENEPFTMVWPNHLTMQHLLMILCRATKVAAPSSKSAPKPKDSSLAIKSDGFPSLIAVSSARNVRYQPHIHLLNTRVSNVAQ